MFRSGVTRRVQRLNHVFAALVLIFVLLIPLMPDEPVRAQDGSIAAAEAAPSPMASPDAPEPARGWSNTMASPASVAGIDSTGWSKVTGTYGNVRWLVVMSANPSVVYAAVDGTGMFISQDAGRSWAAMSTSGLTDRSIQSFAICPSGSIFAGTWGSGVFRYDPRTAGWEKLNNGLVEIFVSSISCDSQNVVLAGTFGRGVFRSTDAGASWKPANAGIPDATKDRATKTLVWLGSVIALGTANGAYLSADGGQTWTAAGLAGRAVYDFGYDRTGSGEVWAGTDIGVFSSKNGGGTWTFLNGPAASTYTVSQGSDLLIYAGTKDSGIYRHQGGAWVQDGLNGNSLFKVYLIRSAAGDRLLSGTSDGIWAAVAALPQVTLSMRSSPPGALEQGNQLTYYIDYKVEGGGIASGVAITNAVPSNVVLVPGSISSGGAVSSNGVITWSMGDLPLGSAGTFSYSVEPQDPVISLVKSGRFDAGADGYASVGELISYEFLVTNSGNMTLTGITVTDPKVSNISCPANTLAAGSSMTCTGKYSVTQADIDAGFVYNVATADSHESLPYDGAHNQPLPQRPYLSLAKTALPATYSGVGDVIGYAYKLTNSGNVMLLAPFTVTDDKATAACPGEVTSLAPGATVTCTASYTIGQADLDAGSVTNHATATAKFGANTVTSNQDSETVSALQTRALSLDKTASETTYVAVGDVLHYSYRVTNAGNVTLHQAIAVSDNKATVSCPALPGLGLAPGAFLTCTASYTIGQADLNAGMVTNTAQGHGYFGGTAVHSNQDSETVYASQSLAVTLVKSAAETSYASVGAVLHYSFLVTNSGNVSLLGPVTVSDDMATDEDCPLVSTVGNQDAYLDPGESITCVASYKVTQTDLNAGSVTNIANASAGGRTSNPAQATVSAVQTRALTLVKTAAPGTYSTVGAVVSYSYKLTNSGNVTLVGPFTVTDDKATATCPSTPTSLAPGAFVTCTASYTIGQADLNAGMVTNTAQGHGYFGGTAVHSNQDSETVSAAQNPALSIDKTALEANFAAAGDVLHYNYVVSNAGNVTLHDAISVSDDKAADESCPDLPEGGLAPGATITCGASYTVTPADSETGWVTNVASASSGSIVSPGDTVTVLKTQSPRPPQATDRGGVTVQNGVIDSPTLETETQPATSTATVPIVNLGAYAYWSWNGVKYEARSNGVVNAETRPVYLPVIRR